MSKNSLGSWVPSRQFWCRAIALGILVVATAGAASAAGSRCANGPTELCLGGRFTVEASWRDEVGRERAAVAVPLTSSATGGFSFAGGEAVDLLVRVGDRQLAGGERTVEAVGLADVAYELRIVDTWSGVAWTQSGEASGEAGHEPGGAAVSGLLEAPNLLGGRFRAVVSFKNEDGHASRAWAVAGGGASGLFAAAERGEPEVALRVVDGSAVNGYFWMQYSALSAREVEIEIVDLVSGNSRRFVKPAGSPASATVTDALSASAAVVQVTLDTPRAVTKSIGPAGGFLEATDARGTKFRLVLPKAALISTLGIRLTPAATIAGLPFSGGLAGAVYVEPEGLVLSESGLLTVTPSPALPRAQQLTFAFRGLNGELSLTPPLAGQVALVVPVHRLGGYGLGAGTGADLAAQLGRLPTSADDRFLQKMAGLLLPPRRAGNAAGSSTEPTGAAPTAVPAGVLQLLQQEYTAGVRSRVLEMRNGRLETTFPRVRNWRNTARDTGQTSRLPTQHSEIRSAEISSAVTNYNAAAACGNVAAATRMYRAYALLRANSAQGRVDSTKLLLCARFELKWESTLDLTLELSPEEHWDVQVKIPLQLNLAGGYFAGKREVTVNKDEINVYRKCNAFFSIVKNGATVAGVFVVKHLYVAEFAWYENSELLTPLGRTSEILYTIDPASDQHWILTCEQFYPPAPRLRTVAPFDSSWSGFYASFHLMDLDFGAGGFVVRLEKSTNPLIFAKKEYQGGGLLPNTHEDTAFLLFFGSAPN